MLGIERVLEGSAEGNQGCSRVLAPGAEAQNPGGWVGGALPPGSHIACHACPTITHTLPLCNLFPKILPLEATRSPGKADGQTGRAFSAQPDQGRGCTRACSRFRRARTCSPGRLPSGPSVSAGAGPFESVGAGPFESVGAGPPEP